jgi:hypothetical protein
MNFYEAAKKKLEAGTVSPDRKASAMAPAVKNALLNFCGQDGEFAQAVAQGNLPEWCNYIITNMAELERVVPV